MFTVTLLLLNDWIDLDVILYVYYNLLLDCLNVKLYPARTVQIQAKRKWRFIRAISVIEHISQHIGRDTGRVKRLMGALLYIYIYSAAAQSVTVNATVASSILTRGIEIFYFFHSSNKTTIQSEISQMIFKIIFIIYNI